MRRRAILGYGAAGVGAVALMLFVGWWQVDGPGGPEPVGQRPVALTEMDFRLTDHEGNVVGPETLIGRPTMAFFGFTYCPDVCPTTLSDISGWLDDLGDEADEMNVVFITVDPERDTQELLKSYMANFDPSFVALHPSPQQLQPLLKDFKIYAKKVEGKTATSYTMDHSAQSYVYDPQGRLRLYSRYGSGPQALAEDVRLLLKGL